MTSIVRSFVVLIVLSACGSQVRSVAPPAAPAAMPAAAQVAEPVPESPAPEPPPGVIEDRDIDSKDVLARTDAASVVMVVHVLVAWRELADNYHGHLDPRAAKRSNAEAAALAQELAAKLAADPSAIDALIHEYSEDPGSLGGDPYEVKDDAPFVPEFKQLALRLHLQEVGIVKTRFGYHVMLRVPPRVDPLESADILKRPAQPGPVMVQHILIGWKGTAGPDPRDPRAEARSKAEADALAKELLGKVRKRGDMTTLIKQYSEDPGPRDKARRYEISSETPMIPRFKDLALRLKLGEAGLVKSPLGWHVVKRVPPPPPDPLESAAILKRTPRTQAAMVKHILLGWTEAHAEDERGKTRDRPTLEKLVKTTLARLKRGEKIEPLMAELSEDPGSATSGQSYEATPDAGLVAPFKNLALRLEIGEVGVVRTEYGIHILQRVE